MIRIFHAVKTRYLSFRDPGEDVDFPGNYVHVADVKTNDLEKAFELTNTISHRWWKNPGVKADWEGAQTWLMRRAEDGSPEERLYVLQRIEDLDIGFRSTSVGDVMEKNGQRYIVAGTGFEPLGWTRRAGASSTYGAAPRGSTDIHGSSILTYEGKLPDKIARAMTEWRRGMRPLPKGYVQYHEKVARKALKDLRRKLGFEIHKTWMAPSGSFDAMQLLHAIVRTREGNHLVEMVWYDSHGGGQWMQQKHGQVLMSESALQGLGAAKMTQADKRRTALDRINEVLVAREDYLKTLYKQGDLYGVYGQQLAKNRDGIQLAASLFLRKYKQFGRGLKELRKRIKKDEVALRRLQRPNMAESDIRYFYDQAHQMHGMQEALRVAEGGEPKNALETL